MESKMKPEFKKYAPPHRLTHAQGILYRDLQASLDKIAGLEAPFEQDDLPAHIADKVSEINQTITPQRNAIALKPAAHSEYQEFLAAHMRTGGMPTYYYDYQFGRAEFLVVTKDTTLPAGCGADAINVIAAPGVKVTRTEGHNHAITYHVDTGLADGRKWVPVYEDTLEAMWRNPSYANIRPQIEESMKVRDAALKLRDQRYDHRYF
jgi:hypothetical protein